MEKIKSDGLEKGLRSHEYVILDFSSPGCAPCKRVPPLIEAVVAEAEDVDVGVFEVDVVESPEIAQQYFVLGVPTLIVFRSGTEVRRFNAVPSKDKILETLGG